MISLQSFSAFAAKLLQETPTNQLPGSKRLMFLDPKAGAQVSGHPVFRRLQELMPGHLLPSEMFAAAFPGPTPQALSVVSFSFPIHPDTIKENSRGKVRPSKSWLCTRAESDALFREVAARLVEHLRQQNVRALLMQTSALYKVGWSKGAPLAANWSERHAAFACGLGTFGLHHGLITAHGAAHRLMSLVIDAACEPYAAVPENPFGDCLYLTRKKCGACIKRCPAKAITTNGLDLTVCREYSYEDMIEYSQGLVGKATGGCALCMCGVPCGIKIPSHK